MLRDKYQCSGSHRSHGRQTRRMDWNPRKTLVEVYTPHEKSHNENQKSEMPLNMEHTEEPSESVRIFNQSLCDQARQIPLERTWLLSYGEDWQKVDPVCSIDNVCDFWGLFNNVGMPTNSPVKCDFYMFHSGIVPRWESVENRNGGKWNVDLGIDRVVADELWINLLMGLVGEQFAAGSSDAINGISLHLRPRGVRCSVWTTSNKKISESTTAVQEVGDSLRTVGRIPLELSIEFKLHCESIEKGSSFESSAIMKA